MMQRDADVARLLRRQYLGNTYLPSLRRIGEGIPFNPSNRRERIAANDQRARETNKVIMINNILNWGRRMNKQVNPTFGLAELRSEIERAVDEARACGVRHYQLCEVLEQAAQAIKIRHAACTPIL